MAAPVLTQTPSGTQKVAVFLPLKQPIVLETDQPATMVLESGSLPPGIILSEESQTKWLITGVPTVVAVGAALKFQAENVAKEKSIAQVAWKITVEAAKFKAKNATAGDRVEEVDKVSGEMIEDVAGAGGEITSSEQAEVQTLASQSLSAFLERLN